MRKIVIHRRGGYDQLRLEEHRSPPLQPGEVRVAVEAAGVNYADCVVRMGLYASAKEYVGWPITPGFEVAGTIVEVGEAVDREREGERVIAVTRFGGYADEVVVPTEQIFPIPRGFTAAHAAAFPKACGVRSKRTKQTVSTIPQLSKSRHHFSIWAGVTRAGSSTYAAAVRASYQPVSQRARASSWSLPWARAIF